jgi:hypothetical protein
MSKRLWKTWNYLLYGADNRYQTYRDVQGGREAKSAMEIRKERKVNKKGSKYDNALIVY